MTWFPIGPDFVYTPRDPASPQRLSRRNMYARQTQIWNIAVDPNDPMTLYTVDQDTYISPVVKGGAVGHRTGDGGKSWTSITDSLQQVDFTFTPTCFAVHPLNSNYVYMGTNVGTFYVSNNKGQQWGAPVAVTNGRIAQIVVDPRNAIDPSTTTIYVATGNGLFVSSTGGASFGGLPVLAGTISSLAFSLLLSGADCYAGVFQQGIYYSTNPTSNASWAAATGNGLPAVGTYDYAWLQFCPVKPKRAYCYFESVNTGSVALCTTGKGGTQWTKVNTNGMPSSSDVFAVAPNSAGSGGNGDILFLGHLLLSRSTDGGQNWVGGADAYHVDQRSFAFNPPNPPMGTIPTMLVGNDGGLIGSTGYADPNYPYGTPPTDFDDGATYNASSGVAQNLNQGKISAALHAYNADPSASSIGYIVCDDTGLAGHSSALGWRGLGGGDAGQVACTPGSDGMKIWATTQYTNVMNLLTDTGVPGELPVANCTLNGSGFASSSNHILSLSKTCIAGTVTNPGANPPSGPIIDIDQTGIATQISQVFAPTAKVVATSPVDKLHLACVTRADYTGTNDHLFVTSGVPLNANTMWSEATTNLPAGIIASVAIDHADTVYALMQSAVNGTPLYSIANNAWTAITSTGLPGLPYGKLVADAVTNGTLYAVSGGRVFRVVVNGNNAVWTEVGSGLPGPHVEDLWVGQIPEGKVLLRATIAARGVWEHDVTLNAVDPPMRPYLRDHLLDQGWVVPSPDGLVNPFSPAAGKSVFHYQSADIKIDAQQKGAPAFFQTDPEGTLPLSHVLFDVMADNSQNLPGSDAAMVHVQVRNRSYTALNSVSVWAVYASAAAGVPGLNKSPSMGNNFPFWSQFQASGAIVPNLPSDSPWTSVGAPVTLSGIDVTHPQVASWNWTVPLLTSGDPGHYCMVVFIHSGANPINETTNYNVDSITPANAQIGQKNLHIGPPLAVPRKPGLGGQTRMREYIEFHNPGPESRIADLVFDLRPLPPQLQMWIRLSELETEASLDKSITGIAAIHHPGLSEGAKALLLAGIERGEEILEWLERRLDRVEDRLEGEDDDRRPRPKRHPELSFAPTIYRAKPAALVAVRGVRLPAHGLGAALMVIDNTGELPPGSEYRFQVQQVIRGRVIGGSTYVIRIA